MWGIEIGEVNDNSACYTPPSTHTHTHTHSDDSETGQSGFLISFFFASCAG